MVTISVATLSLNVSLSSVLQSADIISNSRCDILVLTLRRMCDGDSNSLCYDIENGCIGGIGYMGIIGMIGIIGYLMAVGSSIRGSCSCYSFCI